MWATDAGWEWSWERTTGRHTSIFSLHAPWPMFRPPPPELSSAGSQEGLVPASRPLPSPPSLPKPADERLEDLLSRARDVLAELGAGVAGDSAVSAVGDEATERASAAKVQSVGLGHISVIFLTAICCCYIPRFFASSALATSAWLFSNVSLCARCVCCSLP